MERPRYCVQRPATVERMSLDDCGRFEVWWTNADDPLKFAFLAVSLAVSQKCRPIISANNQNLMMIISIKVQNIE